MATIKSIEEKAKAYDEAIERARELHDKWIDEDGKDVALMIFPELKESEDEKIRKELIGFLRNIPNSNYTCEEMALWLEKQGGHAKFINGIQVGDKVTRNEDGVLVNLSQLNRVVKKQGEQILANSARNCKDEQNPAWREEDDAMFNFIALILKKHQSDEDFYTFETSFKNCIDWLKSLKNRYTWKPSEEQIKVLNEVLNFAANHESPHWNDYIFGTLNNLIRQLKKLTE